MESKPVKKRRTYIINKEFQWNTILRVNFMFFLSVMIAGGVIYLYAGNGLKVAEPGFLPGEVTISANEYLMPTIAACVVSSLVVGIACITLALVILTHRIAGPLYRLRRTIEEMAKGDLSVSARTRPKDEFKDLSKALQELIQTQRELISGLRDDLALLERDPGTPPSKEALDRIKGRLSSYKL